MRPLDRCTACGGQGVDPSHQAAYKAWTLTEPPVGDGWQVWETVTEGSPITPVFTTAENLVEHLIKDGYNPVAAANFVASGWAPSAIAVGRQLYSDIDSCQLFDPAE